MLKQLTYLTPNIDELQAITNKLRQQQGLPPLPLPAALSDQAPQFQLQALQPLIAPVLTAGKHPIYQNRCFMDSLV